MARTLALLMGQLPRDLAGLAYSYFTSGSDQPGTMARAGEFERCAEIIDSGNIILAAGIVGGSLGGDHLLLLKRVLRSRTALGWYFSSHDGLSMCDVLASRGQLHEISEDIIIDSVTIDYLLGIACTDKRRPETIMFLIEYGARKCRCGATMAEHISRARAQLVVKSDS